MRKSQKSSMRYFEPFPIFAKVGSIAYKSQLREFAKIHPVFHVSQLKTFKGDDIELYLPLPLITFELWSIMQPESIL